MPKNPSQTRTCVVTHNKDNKKNLIRIVRQKSFTQDIKDKDQYNIVLDIKQKIKGRGMYIIPKLEILKTAINKGFIKRHLCLSRSLTDQEKENLIHNFCKFIECQNI